VKKRSTGRLRFTVIVVWRQKDWRHHARLFRRQQFIPNIQLSKIINPKGPERFALFYYRKLFLFADDFRRGRPVKNAAEGAALHVIFNGTAPSA
jgi:hypothetical protein